MNQDDFGNLGLIYKKDIIKDSYKKDSLIWLKQNMTNFRFFFVIIIYYLRKYGEAIDTEPEKH